MPVPCSACVCSPPLALCVPAHPGLCNEGCCSCCPGKGLGKDTRSWHKMEGSGAGLKFRGKKAIKAIFCLGERVRRQAV